MDHRPHGAVGVDLVHRRRRCGLSAVPTPCVPARARGTIAQIAGAGTGQRQPGQEKTKAVEFAGYRVEVPRSWPVYRLADDPTR